MTPPDAAAASTAERCVTATASNPARAIGVAASWGKSRRWAINLCIVGLVILGFVSYVLWKVVPVKIASSEFYDVMQEQAAFGSIKDPKFIEFEILRKADELKIPVKKDNLKIVRGREMITVEAHYEITIDFFNGAYKYVWKFDPIVQRPLFAV